MKDGRLPAAVSGALGLKRGPMLLGRSYAAMAVHVRAVRDLRIANGGSNPALDLIAHTLAAVSTDDRAALTAALEAVAATAAQMLGTVDPAHYRHPYAPSDGPAYNCWECNRGWCDGLHRPSDPDELLAWEADCRREIRQREEAVRKTGMTPPEMSGELTLLTAHRIRAIAEARGAHIYDDGAGGIWEHAGPADGCNAPECRPADGSVTPCAGCEHPRHPLTVCRAPRAAGQNACGCTPADALRAASKHGLEDPHE